jgi:hypothetical protein
MTIPIVMLTNVGGLYCKENLIRFFSQLKLAGLSRSKSTQDEGAYVKEKDRKSQDQASPISSSEFQRTLREAISKRFAISTNTASLPAILDHPESGKGV